MTPPHNLDAEAEVIGAAILHPATLARTSALVQPVDFYHPGHVALWSALVAVDAAHEPVDSLTVWNRMERDGTTDRLGSLGGRPYLDDLAGRVVSIENVEYHAGVVSAKADRRRALAGLREALANALNEQVADAEFFAALEATAIAITSGRRNAVRAVQMRPALREYIRELEGRYERSRQSGAEIVGIPTGLAHLDRLTGGFRAGQQIVLAARPAMGKSALALNIAEGAADTGVPVYILSAEMARPELVERMLASEGGIDVGVLRNGTLDQRHWLAVQNAGSRLADMPISIDDDGCLTIGELRSRVRRWRATHGKGEKALVVVDYLQLLRGSEDRKRGSSREQEVAEISRGLKALAKECACPVISLAQLNRELERRTDKRPMLSDLRESGSVEQDADMVLMLYRDDVYDDSESNPHRNTAELIVAKHRAGALATLWLDWQPQHTRFTARRNPPPPKE